MAGRKDERPVMRVTTSVAIGEFIGDLRRTMKIRQADLALRAGVGRQWIVALEQGKPSLELALVLRTLETLGLELELKPADPVPPWITRARLDAERRSWETRQRRRAHRRTRRAAQRARRLSANLPKVYPELE